jgi:hypothetical protein
MALWHGSLHLVGGKANARAWTTAALEGASQGERGEQSRCSRVSRVPVRSRFSGRIARESTHDETMMFGAIWLLASRYRCRDARVHSRRAMCTSRFANWLTNSVTAKFCRPQLQLPFAFRLFGISSRWSSGNYAATGTLEDRRSGAILTD